MSSTATADVLVLGGGVIGLSIAEACAGAGLEVVLLERGRLGSEATNAAAGMVPAAHDHPESSPYERLKGRGSDLFPELSRRLLEATGIDNGFHRVTAIELAHDGATAEELRLERQEWSAQGVTWRELGTAELGKIAPAVEIGVETAYALETYGLFEPARHVEALAASCRGSGGRVVEGAGHCHLELEGERVVGASSEKGERFSAGTTVVAAGAWSGRLLEPLGIALDSHPMRGQVVVLRPPTPLVEQIVLWGRRYLVPRPGGRLILGSTEEDVGFDKACTAGSVEKMLRQALEVVPGLAGATLESTWAGLRPGSPDGLPSLGPADGYDGLLIATGHYRLGLMMAPSTAEVIRHLLQGQEPPMEIGAFDPHRFTSRRVQTLTTCMKEHPMDVRIRKFDPERFSPAYGASMDGAFPFDGTLGAPFGSSWVVVEPGQSTTPHHHHEVETWFIVEGEGRFAEEHAVGRGDVIYIPPFNRHGLRNVGEDDLLFLAVYWEDLEALEEKPAETAAARAETPRPVLITATPPTPNGDLHIGHLSGPYLAADIHRRYQRLRGRPAYYLSGIDDHQSYVAYKGQQIGKSAREAADEFGQAMHATMRAAHAEPDLVAFPKHSELHTRQVLEVFNRLWEKGHLEAREAPSLHCEACDRYLYEVYVRGQCPHCGAGCCGNACEDCGRPNDCHDLVEPRCNVCGAEPVVRTTRRLYFPLGRWKDQLERYLEGVEMNTHLRSLCDAMLVDGLPEICFSHVSEWGIPIPFEGFEGQVFYVWAEMAAGYLAATEELARGLEGVESWRDFWCGDAEIVQFFGFDNGYFHTLLFPAIYFAYDEAIEPPGAFVMNEFYRLDGLKFSTSRLHLIWGRDLIAEVPLDAVRFFLSHTAPETEQTNFTRENLRAVVEQELIEGIGGWLEPLFARLAEEFGGTVPGTGLWTRPQERFYARLRELQAQAARTYEAPSFSLQRATRTVSEIAREARRFASDEAHFRPLEGRSDERRTSIALELAAARSLALAALPVMPDFASRLWSDLGLGEAPPAGTWGETVAFVPSGSRIRQPAEPYFHLESGPAS